MSGAEHIEPLEELAESGDELGRRLFSIAEKTIEIIEGLKVRLLPASGERVPE